MDSKYCLRKIKHSTGNYATFYVNEWDARLAKEFLLKKYSVSHLSVFPVYPIKKVQDEESRLSIVIELFGDTAKPDNKAIGHSFELLIKANMENDCFKPGLHSYYSGIDDASLMEANRICVARRVHLRLINVPNNSPRSFYKNTQNNTYYLGVCHAKIITPKAAVCYILEHIEEQERKELQEYRRKKEEAEMKRRAEEYERKMRHREMVMREKEKAKRTIRMFHVMFFVFLLLIFLLLFL